MSETIIVAIISLLGTLIGSALGVITTQKLTNYRIEELEKEVREMNTLSARVYKLESENQVQNTKITTLEKTVDRNSTDIMSIRGAKNVHTS